MKNRRLVKRLIIQTEEHQEWENVLSKCLILFLEDIYGTHASKDKKRNKNKEYIVLIIIATIKMKTKSQKRKDSIINKENKLHRNSKNKLYWLKRS